MELSLIHFNNIKEKYYNKYHNRIMSIRNEYSKSRNISTKRFIKLNELYKINIINLIRELASEFNYLLLKDYNDKDEDFKELLYFLESDDRIKISSYNYIENGFFEKSSDERYKKLSNLLNDKNIHNSIFHSVGDSINVGCGQMAAKKLVRRNNNV